MIQNLSDIVFCYIGDYHKLQKLKQIFKIIKDKHVNCLKISNYINKNYLIEKYASQLIALECSFNRLTHLPELPANEILKCYNNQLTHLPELPLNEILYCSKNKLTHLPELPQNKALDCSDNQLPKLPHQTIL